MQINEVFKPCPFCGSEVEVTQINCEMGGVTFIEVRCRCGAEVRLESDDFIYDWTGAAHQFGLNAIEKWNRRDGYASQNETMEG